MVSAVESHGIVSVALTALLNVVDPALFALSRYRKILFEPS